MRQKLAVLGWPVGHSLSPAMHQAALDAEGIDAAYEAVAVPPERLAQAIEALREHPWVGANVTIPHKEAVVPLLDELGPQATLVGAVNTIASRDGRLVGHNTDGAGFLAHLHAEGCDPAGRRAVVLGAGGAARAVVAALARAGVGQLAVLNRTAARRQAVAELAQHVAAVSGRSLTVNTAPLDAGDETARLILSTAELVVNCTSLGMEPDVRTSPLEDAVGALPPACFVYDTVYRPLASRLVTEARSRGLRATGGLGMLAYQGALAWEVWFGRRGPVELMQQVARAALE